MSSNKQIVYQENNRHYLLRVHLPGRMAREASNAVDVLPLIKSLANGEFTIEATYKGNTIGRALYRKVGAAIETVEPHPALAGLIEKMQQAQAEAAQKALAQERLERCERILCYYCESLLGYDRQDHVFISVVTGEELTHCDNCPVQPLDLADFRRYYEQRTEVLQKQLTDIQTALAQVVSLQKRG